MDRRCIQRTVKRENALQLRQKQNLVKEFAVIYIFGWLATNRINKSLWISLLMCRLRIKTSCRSLTSTRRKGAKLKIFQINNWLGRWCGAYVACDLATEPIAFSFLEELKKMKDLEEILESSLELNFAEEEEPRIQLNFENKSDLITEARSPLSSSFLI